MDTQIISEKISFTAFKETCLIHKFGQAGFVVLYGYNSIYWGYKYRTLIKGTNQLWALRSAYYLLFGYITDMDKDYVEIAKNDTRGLKMPISANFGFAFNSKQFRDIKWFKICMTVPLPEIKTHLTPNEALSLLNTYEESGKIKVHTFEGIGNSIMGCPISLKAITEYFEATNEIKLSEKRMRGMNHGIMFIHPNTQANIFVQTIKEKIDAIFLERVM